MNVTLSQQAIAELETWARRNSTLPPVAPLIAKLEEDGYIVDLQTGDVVRDPDTRPAAVALDARTWLAQLETAGAGKATITWSCRPEDWDFERGCPKGQ